MKVLIVLSFGVLAAVAVPILPPPIADEASLQAFLSQFPPETHDTLQQSVSVFTGPNGEIVPQLTAEQQQLAQEFSQVVVPFESDQGDGAISVDQNKYQHTHGNNLVPEVEDKVEPKELRASLHILPVLPEIPNPLGLDTSADVDIDVEVEEVGFGSVVADVPVAGSLPVPELPNIEV